jgi:hypothetical protein
LTILSLPQKLSLAHLTPRFTKQIHLQQTYNLPFFFLYEDAVFQRRIFERHRF